MIEIIGKTRSIPEILAGSPGFGRGTAPAACNESDRNMQCLIDFKTEAECSSTEIQDGRRIGSKPFGAA
jgi:hypothetical protein